MSTRLPTRRTKQSGFTLIELVLTVAMMGLVLGSVGLFQLRSQDHTDSMLAAEKLESRARRTISRVADELRGVGTGFLAPDPTTALGTTDLTFQRPADVSDLGVVVWGLPSRLFLELEPGEIDDGSDNDGDGLVDEQRLVLTRDIGTPDEQSVVLCTAIAELAEGELENGVDDDGDGLADEPGFSIRRVGDLLTIRLTVLVPSAGGAWSATSTETSSVLWN